MIIIFQLLGFMAVGTLGVVINAVVFQIMMKTKIGATKVASLPLIKNVKGLEEKFPDITLAWGFGILAAFVSNFLLDKYFIFQV